MRSYEAVDSVAGGDGWEVREIDGVRRKSGKTQEDSQEWLCHGSVASRGIWVVGLRA